MEILQGGSRDALLFAQHYGLPTRMIDWTSSALVGLYFAVQGGYKKNRQLLILNPMEHKGYFVSPPMHQTSGASYDVIRPKQIDSRLIVQCSVLTYQWNPLKPMNEDITGKEELYKIKIPKGAIDRLRMQLDNLEIDRMSLFPSIESAAIQATKECISMRLD